MSRAGVKNLTWRGGRPRWSPGPALRARGAKGRDLKDDDGCWLSLADAQREARKLNAAIYEDEQKDEGPASGFVYFLWAGEAVKIGFSLDPFTRVASLRTGVSDPIARLVAIPGSTIDERRLHRRFAADRLRGEWFRATAILNGHLFKIVEIGRVSYDACASGKVAY